MNDANNPRAQDMTALLLSEECDTLRARIAELETTLAVREATIQMACDRLGGQVEGNPPHPGNFLQRIDELVDAEKYVW